MGRGKGESALKSVQIVGWFSQNNRNPNPASEPHVIWQRPLFSLSPSHPAPRALFSFSPASPHHKKASAEERGLAREMLQRRFYQTNWNLTLRRRKKDDLSEMPGFLSGGLTVLICGEASMLSASIRKMFLLCMFADFTWRNSPETVWNHCFEKRYLQTREIDSKCVSHCFHRQRSFLIRQW